METGHFYFLKDEYYTTFPDKGLMGNKEEQSGQRHDRPCFYAFQDAKDDIVWLIPISSQVEKYRAIYQKKMEKSGKCSTIVFGEVLGAEKAFLIQNMCPATEKYIKDEYEDRNGPVRIQTKLEKELVKKAKKCLALQRQGKIVLYTDVSKIKQALLKEL